MVGLVVCLRWFPSFFSWLVCIRFQVDVSIACLNGCWKESEQFQAVMNAWMFPADTWILAPLAMFFVALWKKRMLPIGDLESSHQEYTSTKIKQRYIRKKNDMAVCHFMLDPMTSIGVCVCVYIFHFSFLFFWYFTFKACNVAAMFCHPNRKPHRLCLVRDFCFTRICACGGSMPRCGWNVKNWSVFMFQNPLGKFERLTPLEI